MRNKITKFKKASGFTLVELMVYMGLMGIFLAVLLDIFTITLNTKLAYQSTSAIATDSRYILSKLTYDINNTDGILAPSLGVTSSTLQLSDLGSTSTYSLDSGNLIKSNGGVSYNLNGLDSGLDSISFKNIGNLSGKPTIQIIYTVRSKILVNGNQETQTINTTVGTR